ncbi:hypothetical protein [Methanobacterium oryzae]|uniref:hypothetical protein n=1 Tax=Methanobacterium oryzae TaxID=69540 RepID=UPI003D224244
MKKQITLTILLLAAILISVSAVSATNLTVGTDGKYSDIQSAYDAASANGDTIVIADGNYPRIGNSQIFIKKNINITGQSQNGTILNAENENQFFYIYPGSTVTIKNLTFKDGNNADDGGAISNSGTLNIINCTFISNEADHDGGAIVNYGTLTVSGSTFAGNNAGNGGAIYNDLSSDLTITGSTFAGNNAGNGGAIYNDLSSDLTITGSTFTGNTAAFLGGAICNVRGTLTVSGSTFTGNNAGYDGGAIENYGTLTVSGSTFTGNHANRFGGAIDHWGGSSTVHFSRIVGNTASPGNAIYCYSGSVDATNNWWGSNLDPKSIANLIAVQVASVNIATWVILSINATPNTINNTQTSTITADLNHINGGGDLVGGHIPDGTPVTFSLTNGPYGTLNDPLIRYTSSGLASIVFTANAAGFQNVNATADNQNVTASIIIPAVDVYVNKWTGDGTTWNYLTEHYFFIDVGNRGLDDATNVVVVEHLEPGFEFVGFSPFGEVGIWDPDTRTVTWTFPVIAANSPIKWCDILVRVVASNTTIGNTVTVTSNEFDVFSGNNTDSMTITVPAAADISVTKTVNDSTPNVLDTIIYTITVANKGPDHATNVIVNDVLPAGLTFDHWTIVNSSGSDGFISWNATSNTLTINGTYFNPSGFVTIDLYAIVTTILGGQHVDNPVSVESLDQHDWNSTNDDSIASIDVNQAADLSVTKDVDDNIPQIGQTIMYTITAFNSASSPNNASGVKVIDNLPDGVTFVSASSSDYDPNTDTWTVGDLLIGQFKQLFIWVTFNAHPTSTSYTNTAIISSNEYDWNLTNNNESETIYSPVANITLAKEFRDTDNFYAGPITTAHYLDYVWTVIKAYNNGPDTATNVTIQDILPTGLTNTDNWYDVSYDGGLTWTYGPDGSYNFGTGNWTINSIASGAEYWLIIWTQVTQTGDKTNNAAVTQLDQYYTTLGTASATLQVPQEANLILHKEFRSDYTVTESVITTANYNQSVYAILSVTNNGPDDATNININDVFTGFNYQGTYWVNYLDGWILGDTTAPFNGTDWTIPYLGKGQTIWLALAGIVEATGDNAVTNTATETAQDQYHCTWPSATASLDVPPAADVTITKEFRTDYQNSTSTTTTANYHTPVWVMVHITNAGPDAVEGLQVTDILPAGLTYQNIYHVSHDGGLTWTAADTFNAGIWDISTMLNGADYWIAILAQVDGHNTTITNVAHKTQSTFDWNTTNDEGNAILTVPAAADLVLTKTVDNSKPKVKDTIHFTMIVNNHGPDTAVDVQVADKLPAGLKFVSYTANYGTYDPETSIWHIGDLPNGARAEITITCVVEKSGNIINEANVSSLTYDPNIEGNTATAAISAQPVEVNAASNTVGMQETGVPFVGLILAILAVYAGLVIPKRK